VVDKRVKLEMNNQSTTLDKMDFYLRSELNDEGKLITYKFDSSNAAKYFWTVNEYGDDDTILCQNACSLGGN